MQQLNSILLASSSTAKGASAANATPQVSDARGDAAPLSQARQKFAVHLGQLTERLEKPRQPNDSTAVSTLAKTMLQTTEDDELSADDAWLSMVEELNSMATGDLSLEELSSRHGIDVGELEAQLNQALVEFDGDMGALIEQLQQVSGGKALPPASSESGQTQPLSSADRQTLTDALAGSGAAGEGESIEALLKRVESLSPAQQSQFAASVNELMAQLDGDNQGLNGLSPAALENLDDKTSQQLTKLSDMLRGQIQSLLDSDVELSAEQNAQLDNYLELLHKLDQLPLQSMFSAPKDSQQIADDLAQQAFPAIADDQSELDAVRGEIAELMQAVQALFNESVDGSTDGKFEAGLQTVDIKAMQDELDELLKTLDTDLDGIGRDKIMSPLQSQLQALKTLDQSGSELAISETDSDNLARLNQLLSELNQKLELVAADVRVIDASRQSETGHALPPMAEALAQASKQLRAQIQSALQGQQDHGEQLDETDPADFDNLRRLVSESVTSTNELRASTASVNQTGAGLQTVPQGNSGQTASVTNEQVTRATEQPAQSAFETARQSQQAIDILGTGASERLRERVSVMFNSRTQAAEMRLDPPDLGRLSIRLNMNQEQATVSFQVTTPQAREALEQSLPRLRELLAEQGIQLADANVSEQQQNGSREASGGQHQSAANQGPEVDESDLLADGMIEVTSEVGSADGRVDYFV